MFEPLTETYRLVYITESGSSEEEEMSPTFTSQTSKDPSRTNGSRSRQIQHTVMPSQHD